jgi:hypothetical protein
MICKLLEIKVKAELDGINKKFSKQTGNILLLLFLLKKISAYRSEYAADIIKRQRATEHISNTNQLKFIIFYLVTN